MIRKLVFLLILLPQLLLAQNVTVRSGEHGRFTRLVLTLPVEANWNLVENSSTNELEVLFPDQAFNYDTSTTFDRIGRSRINDVRPKEGGTGLIVSLACDCDAQAFTLNNSLLVIDVSETSNSPKTISRANDDIFELKNFEKNNRGAVELSDIRLGYNPGVGPIPYKEYKSVFYPLFTSEFSTYTSRLIGVNSKPKRLTESSPFIARELEKAVDKGLLNNSGARDKEKKELVEERLNLFTSGIMKTEKLLEGNRPLEIFGFSDNQVSISSEHCEAKSSWALNTWLSDNQDPNETVAKKRASIFQEFDKVSNQKLNEYAKALLFYGFGAEARSALEVFSETEDPGLVALSYILDGEEDPKGYFNDFLNCGDLIQVWVLLSAAEDNHLQNLDGSKISRGFEVLPKHLQVHLGLSIAQRLSERGYNSTARDILTRVQRIQGYETNAIRLGNGIVSLNVGDFSEAREMLDSIIGDNVQEKAKSVIGSIHATHAGRGEVSDRLVDLSRIFATELRNDLSGEKIWEAHIRSLLLNARFQEAFQEISDASGISKDTITSARENAFQALVNNASDIVFLKISIDNLRKGIFPVSNDVAVSIANRTLDLGLPEMSIQLINSLPEIQNKPEAILAKARAYLFLLRPEEAEILLIGVKDNEALQLRAEARSQMGDHKLATSLFKEAGKPQLAEHSAWLSGAWNYVASNNGLLAPSAKLKIKPQNSRNTETMTLEMAEELRSESRQTRDILKDLFKATNIEHPN